MKLLLCLECSDVVALRREVRQCACRQSGGRYEADEITASVSGPCAVIGLDSSELERAVRERRSTGGDIRAFLVGESSERVIRVRWEQLRYLQPLRRRA